MDEKYAEINAYIDNLARYLNNEYPNILSDEQISRAKTMFNGSNESTDSIKSQIDELARKTIEEYVKKNGMPGMVRVSLGAYNSEKEVNIFLETIEYICKKCL